MPDVFFNPLAWGIPAAERLNRRNAEQLGERYEDFLARHLVDGYTAGKLGDFKPRVATPLPVYKEPEPTFKNCAFHIWSSDRHTCKLCGMAYQQYLTEGSK